MDIIRVHKDYRKTKDGEVIKSGTICKVTVGDSNSVYAVLRGLDTTKNDSVIFIDQTLRESLHITPGKKYEFHFQVANLLGKLSWMWNTTDTGYRVSAQIAIISLILGILLPILFEIVSCF